MSRAGSKRITNDNLFTQQDIVSSVAGVCVSRCVGRLICQQAIKMSAPSNHLRSRLPWKSNYWMPSLGI